MVVECSSSLICSIIFDIKSFEVNLRNLLLFIAQDVKSETKDSDHHTSS